MVGLDGKKTSFTIKATRLSSQKGIGEVKTISPCLLGHQNLDRQDSVVFCHLILWGSLPGNACFLEETSIRATAAYYINKEEAGPGSEESHEQNMSFNYTV